MSHHFMQSQMGSYIKMDCLYNICMVLYGFKKKKHFADLSLEKTYYFCVLNY
jgi:hypothetical protein